MVDINLLPWRHRKKHYDDNKVKWVLFGSLLLGLVMIVAVHILLADKVTELRSQIRQMQAKKEAFSTLQRFAGSGSLAPTSFELAANIHDYQQQTNQLLVKVSEQYNNNICFTEITRQKNAILFVGNAGSSTAFTNYLKTWQVGDLFSEIKIDSMRQQGDGESIQFRFRALETGVFMNDQGGAAR